MFLKIFKLSKLLISRHFSFLEFLFVFIELFQQKFIVYTYTFIFYKNANISAKNKYKLPFKIELCYDFNQKNKDFNNIS